MDHPDFRKMEEKNLSLTLGVDICINHFVVSYSSMYYSIMLLPVCDCGWTPIGNQLYSMILSVKPCAAMEFQGASFSYHVIGTLLGRLHPFHTENNENTGNMSFGGVFSHLILNIWTIWILICILYIYVHVLPSWRIERICYEAIPHSIVQDGLSQPSIHESSGDISWECPPSQDAGSSPPGL